MNSTSSYKIMLSLLLLITTSFSFGQKSDLLFEKTKQNFKKIEEGTPVHIEYHFEYVGTDTLTMLPADVDCSCTEVTLKNGTTIIPHQKYILLVTFLTDGKIGYQEREVGLIFQSKKNPSHQLKEKIIFKGVVKATKETKEKFKSSKK